MTSLHEQSPATYFLRLNNLETFVELVGAKPLHLLSQTVLPLKSPTGAFIASQTRSMCFERSGRGQEPSLSLIHIFFALAKVHGLVGVLQDKVVGVLLPVVFVVVQGDKTVPMYIVVLLHCRQILPHNHLRYWLFGCYVSLLNNFQI